MKAILFNRNTLGLQQDSYIHVSETFCRGRERRKTS